MITQELQDKLARYLPIRMVVRVEEGKVQGRVEHSFSMDWDDGRVNVFWSGKAYSILGEHQLDGVKWANDNVNKQKFNEFEFVIDPLADDSPIDVDWETWLAATDKFSKRNAKFTVKPGAAFQLRAMAAEAELVKLRASYTWALNARDEAEDKLEKLEAILHPEDDVTED